MARLVNRLSERGLQSKSKRPGLHPDGGGLYLQVKNGGRSWLFRYMLNGKARYMGLGPYPGVPLADARREAEACHKLLRNGTDPLEARRQKHLAAQLETAQSLAFKECAERYINSHKAGWRNAKHAAQWTSTLKTYAYPVFGSLPVQAIDTGLVTKALDPIWRDKPETASRLRQRIEAVLNWAAAHGYRKGDNPARWRGHLDKLLPKRTRVKAVKHFEAMAYTELPGFYSALAARDAISAKALVFTILTAARSSEVRNARLGEIDFASKTWIIPAKRTKSNREHRVPLSGEALTLLRNLKYLDHDKDDTLLFPNSHNKPLSDGAMRKCLTEAMGKSSLTVHGFRSTFRDWAAERTAFPRELAEAALAHVLRDKTEAAYQRGDLLDRRRKLMNAWAKFCVSDEAPAGEIVSIREAG